LKANWLNRNLMVSPVYYTLCTTDAMFRKELLRLNVALDQWPRFVSTSHAHATCHFFTLKSAITAIVCIPVDPKREGVVVAGLLVHEAVHIWQEIRDHIGEKFPSSEFEAYSIQTIAQMLMTEYARQVRRAAWARPSRPAAAAKRSRSGAKGAARKGGG
jgi:hypothetical protein